MRRTVNSHSASLRVSVVKRSRRGQTLILALAILFLLVVLGGIFVTLLLRNLNRVARQSDTDQSLTLSLAGLQYAAQQFRASPRGADWRPEMTEVLWRTPSPPALPPVPLTGPHPADVDSSGSLDAAELRTIDPDYEWLDPVKNNGFPYVRISTGRGRFLLRISYLPTFRTASASSAFPDEFDPNSRQIHIEVIGRPGEFDPNDPTSFSADPTRSRSNTNPGLFRKLEAFVPVGLVDQLLWITNFTGERGPAKIGVPPLRNPAYDPNYPANAGNAEFVQHHSLFEGGIRSNTDLQFLGTDQIRIYPSRAESLDVVGKITAPAQANATGPSEIWNMADTTGATTGAVVNPDTQDDNPANDTQVFTIPIQDSSTLNTGQLQTAGRDIRFMIRDEAHLRSDILGTERSAREQTVPALNRKDATSGVSQYLALTRDSGANLVVPNGAGSRTVNTGMYGLTDRTLDPRVRAKGLYLPNFDDIQHPENRQAIKDEWLQRNKQNPGWFMGRYTPSVRTANSQQLRPISEVILTDTNGDGTGQPIIRIVRTDPDTAQFDVPGGSTTEPGYFYDLAWNAGTPNQGTLGNPRQIRDFDYPENGVFYAEGSIRVRGRVGTANQPRQLTIVSGGTIYIEGNVSKANRASFVGLMAQDNVALNPTAFTRLQFNGDWLPNPAGDGVIMQQNSDVDVIVDDADGFQNARPDGVPDAWVHLRHGAMSEDTNSETAIHLFLPRAGANWPDWNADRYDFSQNDPANWPVALRPPSPPEPDWSTSAPNQLFYWFHQISAGSQLNWGESNYQTQLNPNEPNYERKSFYVPQVQSVDGMSKFRIHVGPKDGDPLAPNQQAYLLSRVSVLPTDRPLRIRIEAMIYAFNGSWFVIPPPFFSQDGDDVGLDSRARLVNTNARAAKTFPSTYGPYPFSNEALNVEVQVVGAINENFPAEPAETAAWTTRTWVNNPSYNQTVWPIPATPPAFRPDMRYRFDHDYRRMVRVRVQRTGRELVAWTAPTAPPGGIPTLAAVLAQAMAPVASGGDDSYVETLPILPSLPASAVVYEGNPF